MYRKGTGWRESGGSWRVGARGCSVGLDGIKMYRMDDGFVSFIFSRAMTDILYCCKYGI
jgi:hypothetical protein